MSVCRYFLGANTAQGFYSCYEDFCTPEDDCFLWVIKGGPGCGKSTMMRKIGAAAENAGFDVEYVLCSGDPDSLDGVYLPQKKLGITDGTSPHVQEPNYPGVCGAYLDLGRFYDRRSLYPLHDTFYRLTTAYRRKYAEAYALLSIETVPSGLSPSAGKRRRRFRTAVTCKGVVTLDPVSLPGDEQATVLHPLFPQYLECADKKLPECVAAISALKEAKALHDELERLYRPYVDFSGVEQETERMIRILLN